MNKQEFLQELRNGITSLSQEERESAMAYYDEFFADAGIENEQAVIASLGDPKVLAQLILKENGVNSSQNTNVTFTPPQASRKMQNSNNNDGARAILIIIIVILSFPIWIGFVAATFGILVAIIATVFGITVSLVAVCAATLGFGFYNLFISPPTGIFLIGVGLVSLGLLMLIVFPLFKLFLSGFGAMFRGIGRLFKNIFGRTGANS